MRAALALLTIRADQASTGGLTVLATTAEDGPLVQGLSAGTMARLIADWATDYPAFLQDCQNIINADVLAAETNSPEGSPMQLVLTGLVDPVTGSPAAAQLASAVNSEWAQGKILDANGHSPPAWPGANAIAYASGSTLTLQWIKGQPWIWIIVGVLLVVAALALYEMLAHGSYTLSAAVPGSVGKAALSFGQWIVANWPVVVVGGVALAAAPFVIRKAAQTREAINEERYAARGGF